MSKILGLDVGTNSIGWAIIDDENKEIVDLGVRIFPVGVQEDIYAKSGVEESKSKKRRDARGARRRNSRYKWRRERLLRTFLQLKWEFDKEKKYSAYELYKLRKKALNEPLPLQDIARIFFHINQRRGFLSNKKTDVSKDADEEKSLKGLKLEIRNLEREIKESNCRTLGEYFFFLFEQNQNHHNRDEAIKKIRSTKTSRKLYLQEFNLIWDKQKDFHKNDSQMEGIFSDENKLSIGKRCIFYQRPLKSQKGTVGKCRFEASKRCAPRSSLLFQEFRIWQTLNNIRVTTKDRFGSELNQVEKEKLFEQLREKEKLGLKEIKTLLGFNARAKINLGDEEDELKGNTTIAKMKKVFGDNEWQHLSDAEKFRRWHTWLYALNDEWLQEYAMNEFGLNEDQSHAFVEMNLEPDYGNISSKAIAKILPFLKKGIIYSDACKAAGYHHSYREDEDSSVRMLSEAILPLKNNELRNPIVQQAVSEAIRLVNAIIRRYGKPEKIRIEFARHLKKPKGKREKIKRENDETSRKRKNYAFFLSTYFNREIAPESSLIQKYELWLEMGCESDDINGFAKFSKAVKAEEREKYELWLESDRISPYSGKAISLSKLFTEEIEIDHIIPYSKSMDDSFVNKILCEASINSDKKDRLPFDYFSSQPGKGEWDQMVERLKSFRNMSEAKINRLMMTEIPDGFLSNQLNNTAYIGTELRKKLKTVCYHVEVTNGQVTSKLRRLWGMNGLLKSESGEKSRNDHRHHTVDALVIACTNPYFINKLSRESQFDASGKLTIRDFPDPWDHFWDEAKEKVNSVLVSYRNKKRVLSSKINEIKHNKNVRQQTYAPRGPLHEKTIYGKIFNPHTNQFEFVVRKPLVYSAVGYFNSESQIERIVDPTIRQMILERSKEFGLKKALEEGIFLPNTKKKNDTVEIVRKPLRIKNVRITTDANELPAIRRFKEANKDYKQAYVEPGSNLLIALYGYPTIDKRAPRAFETISFLKVVQTEAANKVGKESRKALFYPTSKNNLPLLTVLSQNDLVLVYDEHPDELNEIISKNALSFVNRLYRVMKFDIAGQIFLARHQVSGADVREKAQRERKDIIQTKYSTFKGLKVKVDVLGNISVTQ